tara:strand:+ start:102 stop:434 length:333 start_codon:yes stop_codon:yes gene_type:complete
MISQTVNYKSNQIKIGNYQTKYFTEHSKNFFEQLEKDGVSILNLRTFAMMEDEFLRFEILTVYRNVSYIDSALSMHDQMQEKFRGWDLSHHKIHIEQMRKPDKIINTDLS